MKSKFSLVMVILGSALAVSLILLCFNTSNFTISILLPNETTDPNPNTNPNPKDSVKKERKTFHELAVWSKTDKVTTHKYECIYEETLKPYRDIPGLKILEIGLGCGMPYGPGASYKLWNSYFSDAKIYFLEYDKECGEKWYATLPNGTDEEKKRLPIMTYGDQANRTLLQEMVKAHAHKDDGGWDIIVDDGGHQMIQEITSFEVLWLSLRPNGYYFIEDLYSSLAPAAGGTNDGLSDKKSGRETAINLIARTFASSIVNRDSLGERLDRLLCCDQICGLRTLSKNKN